MKVEIKFKKIHPDAKLPVKNHSNRALNKYELDSMEAENKAFAEARPEMAAQGYRVGYPMETDNNGNMIDKVLGTGDTGYDIYSVADMTVPAKGSAVIDTGIEVAYVTPGYWFRVEARSGLGFKYGIFPHGGIIDNSYRGNLGIKLYNYSDINYDVTKGDKIAQIVLYPVVEAEIGWMDESIETDRGAKGFGSSGK